MRLNKSEYLNFNHLYYKYFLYINYPNLILHISINLFYIIMMSKMSYHNKIAIINSIQLCYFHVHTQFLLLKKQIKILLSFNNLYLMTPSIFLLNILIIYYLSKNK